jgi:hypothetical protein
VKLPRDARRVQTGCRDSGLSHDSCAFVKLAPTHEGIGKIGQVERVIAREGDSIMAGTLGEVASASQDRVGACGIALTGVALRLTSQQVSF